MKTRFRPNWRSLLILAFLFAVGAFISSRQHRPITVNTISPQIQDLEISLTASGTIKAEKEANLSFLTPGTLSVLNVGVGDEVKQGEVIAALQSTEVYQAWQNALLSKQKAIAAADEIRETYGEDVSFGIGYYRLKQAEKSILQADTNIAISTQQLSQQYIKAPFSGVVLETNGQPGEVITATDKPVIKIADINSVYFSLEIDEEDIGLIKVGQKIKVSLDAYHEKTVEGEVSQIKKYTTTDETGNQVIEVKIKLKEINGVDLILGMGGDADISLETVPQALTLLEEAIQYEGGKPYVWLLSTGRAVKREISLGRESEDRVQVLTGLVTSDIVILPEDSNLKPGQRIVKK